MNNVNALALITSFIILIKATILLVKPKETKTGFSRILKDQKKLSYLSYGLFLLVLILVMNEMTLAQIMVGLLMGSLIMGGILYGYKDISKELESIMKKIIEKTDWIVLFIIITLALVTIFSIIL
ncbi:hypothetical protein GYA25_02440 [Candidatus Woesearchaeota archaeon]|nr:hypothetical protein [Candidatus Woesearchaeota archaeon]